MKSVLRPIFKMLPESIKQRYYQSRQPKEVIAWLKKGSPAPPPHLIKQIAISTHQEMYGTPYMVETGTYLGYMIDAQKHNFEKIISIELGKDLWERAVRKYRNDAHISILNGDSGKVLYEVVPTLDKATLFWLDGHYSSGITARGELDCPIFGELGAIMPSMFEHVILIDDARCFIGTNDYPTLEAVKDYIESLRPGSSFEVKNDSIRIVLTCNSKS